jgi:hypothetical protein
MTAQSKLSAGQIKSLTLQKIISFQSKSSVVQLKSFLIQSKLSAPQ